MEEIVSRTEKVKIEYKTRLHGLLNSSLGEDILKFLLDEDVTEVYLNPDKKLWIDTFSKGRVDTGKIIDADDSARVIKIIANATKSIISEENPYCSGEMPVGQERFQGVFPPIVTNPTFNIRKKAIKIFTLDEYLSNGTITNIQYEYLKKIIKERKNILVIGGTGTGKTTLTNALLKEIIKTDSRLMILEDTQELQVEKSNDVVFMRTSDTCNMRDLLKMTMRMRPDRICIGEIRDGASHDLLKAWNSGHPGGICTIHADDCENGLYKLEDYCLEVSEVIPKRMIGTTIDVCILIKRIKDDEGRDKRIVQEIKEVSFDRQKQDYILRDI